jgi:hypothetical protein
MQRDAKKILKIILVSIFFIFIVVFAFINSKDLIFGVKVKNVTIDGILAETVTKPTNDVIDIKGITKNAIKLTLNGREISVDKNGNFDENIALQKGYNIITIRAEDKFKNVDEKNYKLIY